MRKSILTRNGVFAGFLLVIFFLSSPLRAEFLVGKGATGAAFLKIPVAARPAAMAGAFTAVQGDANAIEYNPAGLSELERVDINLTYVSYIEDTKLQSVTIGYPVDFKKGQPLGDGFLGPLSDKIFLGFHYRAFTADDTRRDVFGTPIGKFDIRDQVIGVGAGYAPFERLSIGLGVKQISSRIAAHSMKTFAMDMGGIWKINGQLHAGASLLNYGSDKAFISESDPLPTTLRAGISLHLRRFLITADVISGRDEIHQQAVGVEFSPIKTVKLRGGVLNHTQPEFAAGLGVFFSPGASSAPPPRRRETQTNRNVLDDLNVRKDSSAYKKFVAGEAAPIDFGIEYALRTHTDLALTHTVTLKILY